MEEKKTTYAEEMTDVQTEVELTEAANLFSRLSPEAQDAIIDLIKCLLSASRGNTHPVCRIFLNAYQ